MLVDGFHVEQRRIREDALKRCWVCFGRSYLQVHQLELDSLGQQIRENKRNGRLVRAQSSRTSVRPLLSLVMLNVCVFSAGVSVRAG